MYLSGKKLGGKLYGDGESPVSFGMDALADMLGTTQTHGAASDTLSQGHVYRLWLNAVYDALERDGKFRRASKMDSDNARRD